MYKKVLCLILATLFALSLFGCKSQKNNMSGQQENTLEQNVQTEKEQLVKKQINEFFSKYVETDERPVAIMIDNDDNNSRPHAGINEAYLVYEMYVEGNSTRMMALFKGVNTEKIGPVRSSRHYFLDYAMENDAIYTHVGFSPWAQRDLRVFGINNINGLYGSDSSAFWREDKYRGDWHSTFTSIERIRNLASIKGYNDTTDKKNSLEYSKEYINLPIENKAENIVLSYATHYTTGYKFDSEKQVYTKIINSEPHKTQKEDFVEFKNVIVQFIQDYSLGDGSARRNIDTTGSGEGYYFTNGCYEKITWSKDSRNDNTIYKNSNGDFLKINPGKTIINIIPSEKISFE